MNIHIHIFNYRIYFGNVLQLTNYKFSKECPFSMVYKLYAKTWKIQLRNFQSGEATYVELFFQGYQNVRIFLLPD